MNRLGYVILKILKKKNCTSHFHSMTLQEIMEISKSCRTTTSRKIKKLREQGYVERGCGDWQAYTYYITEKPSDGIIPNDMTETLMKMAERQQNYAMNSNFKMPELKVKDASGNSVNNVYNTFTVQGDLTRDTLPELNKILDLASSKTQNDIRKNKRRFG